MSGKHGQAATRRRRPRTGPGRRAPAPATGRRAGGASGWSQSPAAATGSRAIFRKEALEFHARGQDLSGKVVRLGAPWLRWSYRLTLALVAAGAAGIMLLPAKQSSYGSAVIDSASGRFAALFPAAVAQDLEGARGLSFALPGKGMRPARVAGVHVRLAQRDTASRAGLAPPSQPSILLTGRLLTGRLLAAARPGAAPVHADAAVILPARNLVGVLAQEVKVILGKGVPGS